MTDFNHRLLRLAREARGWPQTRLGKASGIAQGTVSKYEKGLMSPGDSHLKALAGALNFPVEFFRQLEAKPTTILYRTRSLRSARREALVRARLNLARLVVARLLDDVHVDAVARFPDPDQQYASPESAAAALRTAWGIVPGPVDSISDRIEMAGGIVVRADLGVDEAVAAYLHPLGDPIRWFFVNTRVTSGDRVRFSLAHELGHAVLHEAAVIPDTKEAEDAANRFAGAFTLPTEDLLAELPRGRLQLSDLMTVKRQFGVSMQTVAMGAKQAGVINDKELSRLYKELGYRGWRTNEPGDVPIEVPNVLSQTLSIQRNEHGLTDHDLAAVANVSVDTLQDLFPEHFQSAAERHLRVVSSRT